MKITYLFGAGASAGATGDKLPIVANMPGRLINFSNYIKTKYRASTNKLGEDAEKEVELRTQSSQKFALELDELIAALVDIKNNEIIPKTSSVDTYAKQLLIRGDSESNSKLTKLKRALISFFAFEQKVVGIDLRYDSFFASIIKDSKKDLPDIKIISWNYDLQFELAFSKYSTEQFHEETLTKIQKSLGVVTKRILPKSLPWPNQSQTGFSIYKLNGSTSYYNSEGESLIPWDHMGGTDQQVDRILDYYHLSTQNSAYPIYPSLSFAWEKEEFETTINQIAAIATRETEVLVIIGYSFPFFNRPIDQSILKSMKPQKIYIQDKNPTKILSRFKAAYGYRHQVEYVVIDDIYQFALPDELTI